MSELYLVRHAQASFGSDNYDQLSVVGHQQSRFLGEYFRQRSISFDQVMTGDLQRHHQTLESMSKTLEPQHEVAALSHPGLNEYDFESLTHNYINRFSNDDLVCALVKNPSDMKAYFRLLRRVLTAWRENRLESVTESWADFDRRVQDAQSTLQSMADKHDRILAISSGGAISLFLGTVLGLSAEKVFDLNLQMRNTSISHFYFNRDKMNLSSFNAVPHLDHPERNQLITYG